MCGEKLTYSKKQSPERGSPPRVRGKASCSVLSSSERRITPACAGKSARFGIRCCAVEDHPRVCGEKAPFLAGAHIYHGSPPRVRGKVCNQQVTKFKLGITPACAGKRPRLPFFDIFGGDHPRVCGEKARCTAGIFPVSGSPSRVRGKVNTLYYRRTSTGITPACAGKSLGKAKRRCWLWDHPRVCGEKRADGVPVIPGAGSPPRVRGKD